MVGDEGPAPQDELFRACARRRVEHKQYDTELLLGVSLCEASYPRGQMLPLTGARLCADLPFHLGLCHDGW